MPFLKKRPFFVLTIGLFIAFLSVLSAACDAFAEPPAAGEKLEAYQIIKCADDLMRGKSCAGKSELTVITPKWTRRRVFDYWNAGYDKSFVRIIAPEKEKGTGSLRIKYDFWHYMIRAERSIKLAPSLMLQPWIGSDFTNDDLVKMSSISRDYVQTIVGEEEKQGFAAYKIKLTPKPEAPVVWGGLMVWIRKADCVPLYVEYSDEDGKLVRTLEYSDIKQMDDRVVPATMTMQYVEKPGKKSILKTLEAKYNISIPDHIFTVQNLEGGKEANL